MPPTTPLNPTPNPSPKDTTKNSHPFAKTTPGKKYPVVSARVKSSKGDCSKKTLVPKPGIATAYLEYFRKNLQMTANIFRGLVSVTCGFLQNSAFPAFFRRISVCCCKRLRLLRPASSKQRQKSAKSAQNCELFLVVPCDLPPESSGQSTYLSMRERQASHMSRSLPFLMKYHDYEARNDYTLSSNLETTLLLGGGFCLLFSVFSAFRGLWALCQTRGIVRSELLEEALPLPAQNPPNLGCEEHCAISFSPWGLEAHQLVSPESLALQHVICPRDTLCAPRCGVILAALTPN